MEQLTNALMATGDPDMKKRRCALLYSVCSTKEQASTIEKELNEYAVSLGYSVQGFFFDRAGESPQVLVDLLEICSELRSAALIVQNRSSLTSKELSSDAVLNFASSRGVRIVFMAKSEGSKALFNRTALRYLKHIGNYFGYGQIEEKPPQPNSELTRRSGSFGRLPLGYRIADADIEVSPRQAEAVTMIFTLFSAGVSAREIESRLSECFSDIKLPTRNQIYFIINNSRYIGSDANGIALPPIIDNRLWLNTRAEAGRRGLGPKEHYFTLSNVFFGKERMRPAMYCRGIHSSAYILEREGQSVCINAASLEAAVIDCASKVLESELPDMLQMCRQVASMSSKYAADLARTLSKRDSLARSASDCRETERISTKAMVKRFDLNHIEAKLSRINEEYERFLVDTLSRSDAEIDEFFDRMKNLRSLCAEEAKYFLNILVKEVIISADELCVCCYTTKLKRIHVRSSVKVSIVKA